MKKDGLLSQDREADEASVGRLVNFRPGSGRQTRAAAGDRLSLSRMAVLALVVSVVFQIPRGLAAESKWTIENYFSGQEVEAYVSRDYFAGSDDAFLQRLIAEGCLREGEPRQALDLLESGLKGLRKSTKSDDVRLQSFRIALAGAYAEAGQSSKSLAVAKIVLQNQLEADKKEEATYRKRLSPSDLLEKDVETQTQFELRYQNLNQTLKVTPFAVITRQTRRLYLENRLLDALAMSEIGIQLLEPSNKFKPSTKKSTATAGDASAEDLLFVRALIFFSLDKQTQLADSVERLTTLVGVDSDHSKEDQWAARLTFLNGLVAQLDGKKTDAEKLYGAAIDAAKTSADRYDVFLFRTILAQCLMASGDPVAAYEEYNHAFEDSRRLIEGRERGLDYKGIAKVCLNSMYRCLLVRMSYAEESNTRKSDLTESNEPHPCGGDLSVCTLNSATNQHSLAANVHKEDYQRLANALYHVGYQNKVTGNQSRARQLFWYSAHIYEKHVPENRQQLAVVLYDLAESFGWSDVEDVAVAMFERCAALRKQIDPDSNDYIMTLNTLGRAYMANGEPKKATDALRTALALYVRRQESQERRVRQLVAQLKSNDKFESISTDVGTTRLDALSLEAQLNAAANFRAKADSDVRAQIEDLWQVIADSLSRDKSYDEAKQTALALLKLRKESGTASKDELLGSVWQFAYICGVSNSLEDAKKYYSEMIEKFTTGRGKPLADWYYNRGVVEDSLGQPEAATRDFKRAISEYKVHLKTLNKIDDAETIQHIGWMVADLQLELKAKSKCPPNSPDYFHSYPHFKWGADRFPLKVYIDDTEKRGFGPKLHAYMKKAVDEWSSTPGMQNRFEFVDDREKADIYIERMSNYDLIPYGSGGGATASFVNRGKTSKKEIDRVHLRLYCRDHELDRLSRHTVEQLYSLALHEFGHGLGLGHSPSGGDVMYWKSAMNSISGRDRSTLLKIYSFPEARSD